MSEVSPEDMTAEWKGGVTKDRQGLGWLANRLNKLQHDLDQLKGAAPLTQAGITVTPEGLIVDRNLTVTGTLSLPVGIIDNEALAAPVEFSNGFGNADAFAVPVDETTITSMTFTVPAGYTEAIVVALGTVFALNTTPDLDYLRARVYLDHPSGALGWGRRLLAPLAPNNGSAALSVNHQDRLTNLTGGQTITCRLAIESDFAALSAHVSNGASINAFAIFRR